MPMLEPSDSQECKDFTRLAFDISEQFDTPVMLRTTTRTSHGKSIVTLEEPVTGLPIPKLTRNAAKFVMLPGNARSVIRLSKSGPSSSRSTGKIFPSTAWK